MSFRSGGRGRALLPFGLEYGDITVIETEKAKLLLPVNGPLNTAELDASKQVINFQKTIKDGSFYTGSMKMDSKQTTEEDGINDGIKRYSDRYRKVRKIGRSIDEHPYQLEFFPEELYSVMGIDKKKKRLLAISNFKSDGGVSLVKITEEDQTKSMLEKLKAMAEDLDENPDENVNEEAEEDLDDEFEEDDDDDYNAEKYFDDGDDDGGDDGNDEDAF